MWWGWYVRVFLASFILGLLVNILICCNCLFQDDAVVAYKKDKAQKRKRPWNLRKSIDIRNQIGMKQDFSPFTSQRHIRLPGLTGTPRQRDVIDVC